MNNSTSNFQENKRIQKEEVDLIVAINELEREHQEKRKLAEKAKLEGGNDKPGAKNKQMIDNELKVRAADPGTRI